jgi:hypothetical protein
VLAATTTVSKPLRAFDGCLHFSDLKQFARTPAHFRHAIEHPREATRAMRKGTLTDLTLLGGEPPPIWSGTRQGKAWKEFAARNAGEEICTQAELDEAEQIAAAVKSNALAMKYLTGRAQVRLEWEMLGIRCATRGVDVVGDRWISDLKVTRTAEPERFSWHARSMLWHAQLAFYDEACRQNGIDTSEGCYLVGAEAEAPHPVTVMRVTPRALEAGAKCIHLWLEQLRACEATNEWPGYVQSVVELDVDEELRLVGLVDADDVE